MNVQHAGIRTNIKIEQIRRITGYLVGSLNRWNSSKQSEEQDRVKHGLVSMKNSKLEKEK